MPSTTSRRRLARAHATRSNIPFEQALREVGEADRLNLLPRLDDTAAMERALIVLGG